VLHNAVVGSVAGDPTTDLNGGVAATVLDLPSGFGEKTDDILLKGSADHPVVTVVYPPCGFFKGSADPFVTAKYPLCSNHE